MKNTALRQHRAGLELFADRIWLFTVLASLSDGVIATDATGSVRYLNHAAESMTRWSSAQATGRPIEEVYPLLYLDRTRVFHCQLRRALAVRQPILKAQFLLLVRGSHELLVEDAASPIIENGNLLGAVTIFRDLTAGLDAEEDRRREFGRLATEVQQTSLALGQTQEDLRALSGRLITAQEDERRRLARELHDDLGQRAALMAWRITELEKMADTLPSNVQQEVTRLHQDLNGLSAGLRQVSHQLHPTMIADLGLETALRSLIEIQCSHGSDVTLIARDIPSSIPLDTATSLYRITQEALRNAVQHAPDSPIVVSLYSKDTDLMLTIEDPGPGFDLDEVKRTGGLGLLIMQERARLTGGTLEIATSADQGVLITVCVPLTESDRP